MLQEDRGALKICSELSSVLGSFDTLELRLNGHLETMIQRFNVWEGGQHHKPNPS
jgi:hypothetical protein